MFSNEKNKDKELKLGLNFLLDYNEDRQVSFERNNFKNGIDNSLANSVVELDNEQHAIIYLNTIGKDVI